MKPVISTVTVERSRQEVFDHLDVLANHEAFTDHFLHDWQLSGPERGVGGRLRARVTALGRTEDVELEVVEVREPELIAEVTVAAEGKRRTRGTYRLREAGPARTHVTFELAFEAAPAVERLAAPLGRRWVGRM